MAVAPHQQPVAPVPLQQAGTALQPNVQPAQPVNVLAGTGTVQNVPMQPQGQPPVASGIHAQRPPHPNLFQEALIEHAASAAASASRQIQPGPSHAAIGQSGFGALHTLSSSKSSTTSGSSSSSGGSGSSVSSTDVPIRPTYQSMGPHPNIAFDLYV